MRPYQWRRLQERLQPGDTFEVEYLAKVTRIARSNALAGVLLLELKRAVRINLFVFHTCTSVALMPRALKQGFQPTPWVCPACKVVVKDPKELTYELHVTCRVPFELELVEPVSEFR